MRRGMLFVVAALLGLGLTQAARASSSSDQAIADAHCSLPTDHPETEQGRAPAADYVDGRAALGYTCNAVEVAHVAATSGGYRVYRYVDAAGHVCGFYDTTLLFPANAAEKPGSLTGVWVLDMTDPAHPVHTATLSTAAMDSPHESLSLNLRRGLLGAVMGNPLFYPGEFDLYSVSADCRHPVLDATVPMGAIGHEGSFTPDGNTYYATSLFGHTMTAIDTTNPLAPRMLWTSASWVPHGLNLSDDGKYLYMADLGSQGASPALTQSGTDGTKGLTILDVSQVQSRAVLPKVSVVSHLTWPEVSTPQTDLPFTRNGHRYLAEVDEFGAGSGSKGPVGAARIIDIQNPTHPFVVSNLRLAIDNLLNKNGEQSDPGGSSSLQGYAAHYCSLPSRVNPDLMACSFIASGLRLFDIRNPAEPKEIAYFNFPELASQSPTGSAGGSYAMSQPAYDLAAHDIWYSDGNTGLWVVHIASAVWPAPR